MQKAELQKIYQKCWLKMFVIFIEKKSVKQRIKD